MPALPKANGALLAGKDDPVCHGEVYALWQGVSNRAERTARSGPELEMGEVFCGVGESVTAETRRATREAGTANRAHEL